MESNREYELDDFLAYLIFTAPIKVKLSPKRGSRQHRCTSKRKRTSGQTINRELSQAVLAELERNYGATPAENGWYACYCPYGHQQDHRPGDHAYYHPDKGLFNCFGRHGQHLLHSIATELGVDVNQFGGIYSTHNS